MGKFIYPSFIDIYSDFGIPKTKRKVVALALLNMDQVEKVFIGMITYVQNKMQLTNLNMMKKKLKAY